MNVGNTNSSIYAFNNIGTTVNVPADIAKIDIENHKRYGQQQFQHDDTVHTYTANTPPILLNSSKFRVHTDK